jgi:hypothetical protein
MDWVYPCENRNESLALVKAVMNGVSLLGCDAASLGIWLLTFGTTKSYL